MFTCLLDQPPTLWWASFNCTRILPYWKVGMMSVARENASGVFGLLLLPLFFALLLSCVPGTLVIAQIGSGYHVQSVTSFQDGRGFQAFLELNERSDEYGPDIEHLLLTVRYETDDRLHVKITDANSSRWEIPPDVVPRGIESATTTVDTHALILSVTHHPFAFSVTRKSNGQVLFNSTPPVVTPHTAASLTEAFRSRRFEPILANDDEECAALRSHWETRALLWAAASTSRRRLPTDDGLLEMETYPDNASDSNPDEPRDCFLFNSLVFKDQYLEISTQLDPLASSVYGFGESTRPDGLKLAPGRTYTLWNADIFPNFTDIDLYGAYPYYLDVRDNGETHGVLLLSSNGIEATYGGNFITLRAIGGILDFFFFAGPTPAKVTDQYTALVGRPAPVPYWALGLQQSRYGYKSVGELEAVVRNYSAANIPLDGIWSDIDCLEEFKVFQYDPVNYPEDKMRDFIGWLHENEHRYIVIVDPGIKVKSGYATYQRGLASGIFVKNAAGLDYLAQVWPFAVHFPDFLNPKTQAFWSSEIVEFYERAPFDGLWLDMNEPSTFCSGPLCSIDGNSSVCFDPTICCLKDCYEVTGNEIVDVWKWEEPPFKLDIMGMYQPLGTTTMAMSAIHYGGVLGYNTHNLFGLLEGKATHKALVEATKKRPFIISRSTFVGAGAYMGHWTGDSRSSWKDLEYSIVSILNSGMFGVSLVGADICGFNEDTWEELCNRWVQVGAFYPFSRVHSDTLSIYQELYRWDSVASSARKVLGIRYRLLPYLYTLVFEAHRTGCPIARPLFFEFPDDRTAQAISGQFLLGRALLVSPVVTENAESVRAYIPKGTWYDLFRSSQVLQEKAGNFYWLSAPIDVINVHIRDGTIIPLQEATLTTAASRRTPFSLIVAFSLLPQETRTGQHPEPDSVLASMLRSVCFLTKRLFGVKESVLDRATGSLFLDNDESLEMVVEAGKSTFVRFEATRFMSDNGVVRGSIESFVMAHEFAVQRRFILQKVTILGVDAASTASILVNGKRAPPSVNVLSVGDASRGPALEISGLDLLVGQEFKIQWESCKN